RSPGPTSRSGRRGASGPAPPRSKPSTCRGPPPSSPRAPAASSVAPPTAASWPCSTRDWPGPITAPNWYGRYHQCAARPTGPMSRPSSRDWTDPLVAQPLEGLGPSLPVLVDFDEQLDVGTRRQLLAHRGADGLEHAAAAADDNALLRVAL